jgi:hypothetical protein
MALFILIGNISCASVESDWVSSALEYAEVDGKIVNSGNQSVIELLKQREKAKSEVISSKFPGQAKIIESLDSSESEQNLAAVINLMLREFYSNDTVDSVLKMMNRNENPYMLKFYSYSYLKRIDSDSLLKFEDDILALIQGEQNENLFGVALPLLIQIDSKQSIAVINDFLSHCSNEAKLNICAYISVEKESLLKQLNCQ